MKNSLQPSFRCSFHRLHSLFFGVTLFLLAVGRAHAHDTWVQTNTNVVRLGDVVHLDLMLGNHGNNHRDFKLAGKADVEHSTLKVLAPDGHSYDLKTGLQDVGYAPTEGYWTTSFAPAKPGLYLVAHTFDAVMHYAPVRAVHSAKTFFVASKSLDHVQMLNPGYDRVLGYPLELVPESNPVTPMGPGAPLKVRLLYKGKPLAGATVSFIARGAQLKEGFDARYERKTDAAGRVSFSPNEANYYLVAARCEDAKDKGEGYNSTEYSATLTVFVPKICPCCGG